MNLGLINRIISCFSFIFWGWACWACFCWFWLNFWSTTLFIGSWFGPTICACGSTSSRCSRSPSASRNRSVSTWRRIDWREWSLGNISGVFISTILFFSWFILHLNFWLPADLSRISGLIKEYLDHFEEVWVEGCKTDGDLHEIGGVLDWDNLTEGLGLGHVFAD